MADNIAAAFHALHERWEAIFAREQGRLAARQQDLPQALREMAYATALRETESPTYQAYEQALRDRVDTVEALDGAAWEPDPLLDHRYQSGLAARSALMGRMMSAFRARMARPWGVSRRRRPSTPWKSTGRARSTRRIRPCSIGLNSCSSAWRR